MKRLGEDFANQSWQTMAHTTPINECYCMHKQKLELEKYIVKMNLMERIRLTHFRCAPIPLPTVKDNYRK